MFSFRFLPEIYIFFSTELWNASETGNVINVRKRLIRVLVSESTRDSHTIVYTIFFKRYFSGILHFISPILFSIFHTHQPTKNNFVNLQSTHTHIQEKAEKRHVCRNSYRFVFLFAAAVFYLLYFWVKWISLS